VRAYVTGAFTADTMQAMLSFPLGNLPVTFLDSFFLVFHSIALMQLVWRAYILY